MNQRLLVTRPLKRGKRGINHLIGMTLMTIVTSRARLLKERVQERNQKLFMKVVKILITEMKMIIKSYLIHKFPKKTHPKIYTHFLGL